MIRGIVAAGVIAIGLAAPALAQQPTADPQAQQNVRESRQYDQLTCSNPKFRATRIQKECGPLQGSDFYQSCVASFDCGKPSAPVNPKGLPSSEKAR